MTETTTKKTTAKRTTKKVEADANADSIVVFSTHIGEDLVLRANPTDEAVRSFVEEHTRRYLAGEAGGPAGHPAFRIFDAKRYKSEAIWLTEENAASTEVEIADLLP